jgi:transposase InsO family protein
VGQSRATQRRTPKIRGDEPALTEAIVRLAKKYGRYGYRRVRQLLVDEGWRVSVKRVYRIWRREGLKVPKKQPKRGRLWLNDGSCIRLRPERPNHVWSYDFVQDQTEDKRPFRMLTVIDEFTRRCLAIVVARRLRSDDVLHCLTDLMSRDGPPEHIRSDKVLRQEVWRSDRQQISMHWRGPVHFLQRHPSGFRRQGRSSHP